MDDEPYEEEESKSDPEEDQFFTMDTKNSEKLDFNPIVPIAKTRPILLKHTSLMVNHKTKSSRNDLMSSIEPESPFGYSISNLKLPSKVI